MHFLCHSYKFNTSLHFHTTKVLFHTRINTCHLNYSHPLICLLASTQNSHYNSYFLPTWPKILMCSSLTFSCALTVFLYFAQQTQLHAVTASVMFCTSWHRSSPHKCYSLDVRGYTLFGSVLMTSYMSLYHTDFSFSDYCGDNLGGDYISAYCCWRLQYITQYIVTAMLLPRSTVFLPHGEKRSKNTPSCYQLVHQLSNFLSSEFFY